MLLKYIVIKLLPKLTPIDVFLLMDYWFYFYIAILFILNIYNFF